MKKKKNIGIIAMTVTLFSCLFLINYTSSLEVNIPIEIYALIRNDGQIGGGDISYQGVTFGIDKWPYLQSNKQKFELQYPYENYLVNNSVAYELTVKINDITNKIPITGFNQAGNYKGVVTCCFDGIKSGHYTIIITLNVKGSTDLISTGERTIFIP
jgi:hypothetical protein